jgi:hypothetical protein
MKAPEGGESGRNGGQPPRRLPRDLGYLLILGGAIGFVAPGVLGLDLLALGALILWPGNTRRVERWLEGHPSTPKFLRGSLKQIDRFLASLERRYPRIGRRER